MNALRCMVKLVNDEDADESSYYIFGDLCFTDDG